jgi:hypothetical protein
VKEYEYTKAEWARELDFNMPAELYRWAKDNKIKVVNEERYFIVCFDEYRVFYSRASQRIQCYYIDYGHDFVERKMDDFKDLKHLLKWINYNRENLTTHRTDAIHQVSKEFLGLTRWEKDFVGRKRQRFDEIMATKPPYDDGFQKLD